MASSSVSPYDSCREGKTYRSATRKNAAFLAPATYPGKCTRALRS